MGDRQAKDQLFEQFARVGKALSNPKRLELLDLLAQGPRTVEALARAADLQLTTCSAHLQTLKHARLVTTLKQGRQISYQLAGADVAALYAQLQQVTAAHVADLAPARAAYLGAESGDPIDRDEFWRHLGRGDVTVVDVRPAAEYAAGHIPGSISIPLAELADRLAELPPEAEIVAYCRGAYCVLAHDAVRLLNAQGRQARRLADGVLEWRLAGLPLATAEDGGDAVA